MSIVIGVVLVCIAQTLYLIGYYAARSARPPFWTSENMVMSFVVPVIMAFGISGFALLSVPFLTGTWTQFDLVNLAEVGVAVAVCAVIWPMMSRRHYRSLAQAPVADVISMPAAAAPSRTPVQDTTAPLKAA